MGVGPRWIESISKRILETNAHVEELPPFLRGRFRHSLSVTLQERCRAKLVGDSLGEERAWKAFGLVPMMLLHKPGNVGKEELMERANQFARGNWLCLLAGQTPTQFLDKDLGQEEEQRRRGQAACNRVQRGQVSRARQELTGATLAPKNSDTLAELQGRRPREQVREIPPEVLASHPRPVDLDSSHSQNAWPAHPRVVPQDPGGAPRRSNSSSGRPKTWRGQRHPNLSPEHSWQQQ